MSSMLFDKTIDYQRATYSRDSIGGNTPSFTTIVSGVSAAIWFRAGYIDKMLGRPDLVGDHIVVTDQDLGAKARDRISYGGDYYIVNGAGLFSNAGVSSTVIYWMDTTKRSV